MATEPGLPSLSLRNPCFSRDSINGTSMPLTDLLSYLVIRQSTSPQVALPLLYEPHGTTSTLSPNRFFVSFSTTSAIYPASSRGILSTKSSKYFSPTFWFLFRILGDSLTLSLSSYMVLIPEAYNFSATAFPMPHTLPRVSSALSLESSLRCSSLVILPCSKNSATFFFIPSPTKGI